MIVALLGRASSPVFKPITPCSTGAAGHSHQERRVALFERLGRPELGALVRRRFLDGKLDAEELEAWVRLAFPVYTRTPRDPQAMQRAVRRPDVNHWFARPGGEGRTFNFFPACPTFAVRPLSSAVKRIR
jgi:hypothetical protein